MMLSDQRSSVNPYTFKVMISGPQRYYYVTDHLGSIRTTVNENGNAIDYDDYYPFGLTMPGRSSNSGNPNDDVKFTGYELDDEAGLNLYHANARFYDPVVPRFGQIDPLSDQFPNISPYAYGNNNPLRYTDPTGMAPIDDYGFDITTGQLSLIRETDDDFDVIYTGEFSNDGSFEKNGESLEISKGTLQGKFFDDISKSGLVFRDLSEGLQSMKFLSFNSHTEFVAWAYTSGTEEGLAVSPWEKNTDILSRDFYQNTKGVGYLGEKLFNVHTHPGTRAGYGGGWKPSGVPGGLTGDIPAAEKNPQYPHYILSRHYGVIRYYPFLRNGGAHESNTLNKYFKN